MRVLVDLDKCLGYGNCVADAPEVFEIQGEDIVVHLLQENPPEELRSAVELAVLDCPTRALSLEEHDAG